VSEAPLSLTSRYVGSVFQNPKSQFFNVDSTGELVFGCENQNLDGVLFDGDKSNQNQGQNPTTDPNKNNQTTPINPDQGQTPAIPQQPEDTQQPPNPNNNNNTQPSQPTNPTDGNSSPPDTNGGNGQGQGENSGNQGNNQNDANLILDNNSQTPPAQSQSPNENKP